MVVGIVLVVVVLAVLPGVVARLCIVEETYYKGGLQALRLEAEWIGGQATVPNCSKSPGPG